MIFDALKKLAGEFFGDLLPSAFADKVVIGPQLKRLSEQVRQGQQGPAAGQAGAGAQAPVQPELHRGFLGLGYNDEAARAMVLADITLDEAVIMAEFRNGLERWNREQFDAVVATIPTVAERAQQFKQLARITDADTRRGVAAAFGFIKGDADIADQVKDWLRVNAPTVWQELDQRANRLATLLQRQATASRTRTAILNANRPARPAPPAPLSWSPRVQRANMGPIRRIIRDITGL